MKIKIVLKVELPNLVDLDKFKSALEKAFVFLLKFGIGEYKIKDIEIVSIDEIT